MDLVTFLLALTLGLVALFDFLIGEEGRIRVRNHVETWWIHISEMNYFGIAKSELKSLLHFLHRVFGADHERIRFFVVTTVISVLATTIVLGISLHWYEHGFESFDFLELPELWANVFLTAVTFDDLHTGIYIGNWLGDILSISITLFLIRKMTESHTPKRLAIFGVADVILSLAMFLSIAWIAAIFDKLTAGIPLLESMRYGFSWGSELVAGVWDGEREALSIMAPSVTALLPTFLHIILITSMLMMKWATPVLRPAVLIVLLRLSEAKTGIFTLITGALVTVIKIGQLAVKAFL